MSLHCTEDSPLYLQSHRGQCIVSTLYRAQCTVSTLYGGQCTVSTLYRVTVQLSSTTVTQDSALYLHCTDGQCTVCTLYRGQCTRHYTVTQDSALSLHCTEYCALSLHCTENTCTVSTAVKRTVHCLPQVPTVSRLLGPAPGSTDSGLWAPTPPIPPWLLTTTVAPTIVLVMNLR